MGARQGGPSSACCAACSRLLIDPLCAPRGTICGTEGGTSRSRPPVVLVREVRARTLFPTGNGS